MQVVMAGPLLPGLRASFNEGKRAQSAALPWVLQVIYDPILTLRWQINIISLLLKSRLDIWPRGWHALEEKRRYTKDFPHQVSPGKSRSIKIQLRRRDISQRLKTFTSRKSQSSKLKWESCTIDTFDTLHPSLLILSQVPPSPHRKKSYLREVGPPDARNWMWRHEKPRWNEMEDASIFKSNVG